MGSVNLKKIIMILATAILIYFLCPPLHPALPAEPSPGLDEVLEGFDEPESSSPPAEASGGSELDEVLEGFDEAGAAGPAEGGGSDAAPDRLDISGALTLSSAYNFAHDAPENGRADYRGLSRLRPELDLEVGLDLAPGWKAKAAGRFFHDLAYEINGREDYTPDVLETHEQEAELGEAWLQGRLSSSLDVKIGRQIVVWGKSDNIRVVDVLNPLDLREPGLVDIEDLRLPVTMTKLDYYVGSWNLSAVAVHEIRFNKNPAYGSDFYPSDQAPFSEDRPDNDPEHTEFGLALKGIFSGWDLSFFGARYYDDEAHLVMTRPAQYAFPYGPQGPAVPVAAPEFERRHSRLTMAGLAANAALGNWLLKTEAAFVDGLEFFALPDEDRSRLDVMAGVEYSGLTDTTLALEVVNRHLFDFDDALEDAPDSAEEDDVQAVFRLTRKFAHDTVELVALASVYGFEAENGSFERFTLEYDLTDAWSVLGGVVFYQSGEVEMDHDIADNDRVFGQVKYSF